MFEVDATVDEPSMGDKGFPVGKDTAYVDTPDDTEDTTVWETSDHDVANDENRWLHKDTRPWYPYGHGHTGILAKSDHLLPQIHRYTPYLLLWTHSYVLTWIWAVSEAYGAWGTSLCLVWRKLHAVALRLKKNRTR